jgi:uncharacterized protein (TIGR02391 family)
MDTLHSLFSTAEELLALAPEDLAPVLLGLARRKLQGGMFWFEGVTQETSITGEPKEYPHQRKAEINALINEAWDCLRREGFITSAAGQAAGYMVFTKKGEEAATSLEAFERVRSARDFPKTLLHPTIADKVWPMLMSGDLDDAVFNSFKAVEEAVRAAGGYAQTDFGVDLMRMAFHTERRPLTDLTKPKAEREALGHLFAGAIGSYKNPHSHRTVNLTDPREAQQQRWRGCVGSAF